MAERTDPQRNPRMKHRSFPLAVASAFVLVACGFHPRAELAIPAGLGPVRVVSGDPYSQLGDALARALTRGGAQPAVASDPHVATLRIVGENWNEGPLSVDAFSHVREEVITYTVRFSLTSAGNVDIAPVQEAKLQRDFVYDDSHALGASEEQATIREELQRDMAATIIRRIGVALRNFK
jgi:LPS-assembly lipoprotein